MEILGGRVYNDTDHVATRAAPIPTLFFCHFYPITQETRVGNLEFGIFARTAAFRPTLFDFRLPRDLLRTQRAHGTSEKIFVLIRED